MNKKQLTVVWESIKILAKRISLLSQGVWIKSSVRKSLRKNLEYIFIFPNFKKRLLYHPKSFFFKPSENFFNNCEYRTQRAAEEILTYCGLDKISVKITNDYLEAKKDSLAVMPDMFRNDSPGKIYQLNQNQYSIYINNNYHPKVIAAILSHEISHAYIMSCGIKFKTSSAQKGKFEEQMTDLATIALGLGRLMIDGHFYSFREKGIDYTGTVGYLKSGELRYAQALMSLNIEQVDRKISAVILDN
ncbi:MAG: hypothetical protein ABH882_07000 [Candidatus Omnitrophota bacterium]